MRRSLVAQLVFQYAHAAAYAECCTGIRREDTLADLVTFLEAHVATRRMAHMAATLTAMVDRAPPLPCDPDRVQAEITAATVQRDEAAHLLRALSEGTATPR